MIMKVVVIIQISGIAYKTFINVVSNSLKYCNLLYDIFEHYEFHQCGQSAGHVLPQCITSAHKSCTSYGYVANVKPLQCQHSQADVPSRETSWAESSRLLQFPCTDRHQTKMHKTAQMWQKTRREWK